MFTLKKLISLSVAIYIYLPLVVFAEHAKIDPALHLLSQKGANSAGTVSRGIFKSVPGSAEPLVSAIVRFQGNLEGIEALGCIVRSVMGDVATLDMPLSAVERVSQLPNIVHIESAKSLKHRLNTSVPATGANTLRSGTPPSWSGKTGKGVVIGIIDTGIDLNHKDFKNAAGKTRILSLWDQTVNGTYPAGYNRGNECSQAVIDAGNCSQKDVNGHGTHVAGIAAGNGSATGNGQPAYRYVGMAPEADLIIVKLDSIDTASVLDAIAYIQAKAAVFGKPSVVNLSFGSHNGPHDGTSSFERGLDNLSGVGKVIVAAAGNEAEEKIHASGNVMQSTSTTVGFNIPAGGAGNLDIWYAGIDEMKIFLTNGTCTTPAVAPGNTQAFETACGRIDISSSSTNPNNGDREIVVQLSNGTSPLSSGEWKFILKGSRIINGRFDAWSSDEVATFTSDFDSSITIGDTATATKTIAVGAYITKNTWESIDGNTYEYGIYPNSNVGTVANFSSQGPRRSCSDTAHCPPVQKPEIVAPGMGIMSAFSTQMAEVDQGWVDPDGVHFLAAGTSMAAPHVAGAVALILQAAPTLTSDQIKRILTSYAKAEWYVEVPNNSYGYGKLGIAAAFDTAPDSFSFTPAVGVTPNSLVTSNTITVQGIGIPSAISIVGGEYSINGGAYTNLPGTVGNGHTVSLRLTSASTIGGMAIAVLTIGGVSGSFTVITEDRIPDPFSFVPRTGVALCGTVGANPITVSGINTTTPISVIGGTYSISGGPFTYSRDTVVNGQTVWVSVTASCTPDTTTKATLTIGGVSAEFSVTTVPPDTTPDAFSFIPCTDATSNTWVVSNRVNVNGINTAAPISIVGGEYSIDGGAWTSAAGLIYGYGQGVRVRLLSSANYNTSATATLTIGEMSTAYRVTTRPEDASDADAPWWNAGIISVGTQHALAVKADGTVWAWGYNYHGQLGVGDVIYKANPTQVSGFGGVVAVSAGDSHSLVIKSDGTVWAWGRNTEGQLGDGTQLSRVMPKQVQGLNGIKAITAGQDFSVALKNDGTVWAWGNNSVGQLGDFAATTSAIPVQVNGLSDVVDVAAGMYNSLALKSDGTVWKWGADYIQYPNNIAPIRGALKQVSGLAGIVSVAVHGQGMYALKQDGTVWAWGIGGLGLVDYYSWTKEPKQLSIPSDVIAIDSCVALRSDGTVWAWLAQYYDWRAQRIRFEPTQVTNLTGVVAIASFGYAIALKQDGTIWTWGDDFYSVNPIGSDGLTREPVRVLMADGSEFRIKNDFQDTTPDTISFPSQIGANLSAIATSSHITVSGINTATSVSIVGGEYSVDGGAWTSAAGTVYLNQTVAVRLTSSSSFSTTTSAMLTIGGVNGTFSVTTAAMDSTPDTYSFISQTGVAMSLLVASNTITVGGINVPSDISITGGEYSINGGAWTSAAGSVTNGQTVAVRLTSSNAFRTTTTTTLTIGGVSGTFSVTTKDSDIKDDLVINFGGQDGIQMWLDNSSWQPLHSLSAAHIVRADVDHNGQDDLVVDFGAQQGIAIWLNNSSWKQLSNLTATHIVQADIDHNGQDDVVVDFGAQKGIAIWLNNSNWKPLHELSAAHIVRADMDHNGQDDLVIDFGAKYGIYVWYNGSSWKRLHELTATQIISADVDHNGQDDLVIDFGAKYGSYVWYNGSTWKPLHNLTAAHIVRADVDHNGQDDVVIDFGAKYGIYVWYNGNSWNQLHSLTATHIVLADVDHNGQDDLIIDFGESNGIQGWFNNSYWSTLDTRTSLGMTAAQIDGKGMTAEDIDTTPTQFIFTAQAGMAPSAVVTSNSVTVGGINAPAAIGVAGGEYRIGNGPWTSAAGTITNGQKVAVRLTSSSSFSATTSCTLTVGGVVGTFSATTGALDTAPDAIAFAPQTNVAVSTVVASNPVTVSGINAPAVISVTGGEYSIDGGAWTSAAGSVTNGQTVTARLTSSGNESVTTNCILSIGGISGTFSVTTGTVNSAIKNDLVINFGGPNGIQLWLNNSSWQSLHDLPATHIMRADVDNNGQDDLVIDFGAKYGIYVRYNGSSWKRLHELTAAHIVRADVDHNGQDDLVIDFGARYGIYVWYNGGSWKRLHELTATHIVSADVDHNGQDDLVIDFGVQRGISVWFNNNSWQHLHNLPATHIVTADVDHNGQDDLVIDFGAKYGSYVWYNNSSWKPLHNLPATHIISADVDHNGQDDLVMDFGAKYGIYVWYNNSNWQQLHNLSAVHIVCADIDSSGQDDLVIDFGAANGIQVWFNNNYWNKLDSRTSMGMTAAQLD